MNVSTWQAVIDVSVPIEQQAVMEVSICYSASHSTTCNWLRSSGVQAEFTAS